MLDLKKPICQYTEEDISEAVRFLNSLPREKKLAVIRKLSAECPPRHRERLAHVNPDSFYGYKGHAVNAGGMSGR